MKLRPTAFCVAATLAFVPSPGESQVQLESRAASITLTGRVHTQLNTSSVAGEPFSDIIIRRARTTVEVAINDFVTGKIQPDFGEGGFALKDAYVQLSFDPTFRLSMGQFKRPFDLFELVSSTQILVIERAGGVRGVSGCAGPGGVCSFSRLTEKLDFANRDIGMMVDGRTGRTDYSFAMTNGTGANSSDVNGTKSYSGRVRVAATDNLQIAGNFGVHDYVNGVTLNDDYAIAAGADLEIGDFTEGLHVQAGIVTGQNWANLDAAGDASNFLSLQGIVTHKTPVADNPRITHIEPLARLSWADPDTDTGSDGGVLVTPGFVVYFVGRNKMALNIDVWIPGTGSTEWSFKFQTYLHY